MHFRNIFWYITYFFEFVSKFAGVHITGGEHVIIFRKIEHFNSHVTSWKDRSHVFIFFICSIFPCLNFIAFKKFQLSSYYAETIQRVIKILCNHSILHIKKVIFVFNPSTDEFYQTKYNTTVVFQYTKRENSVLSTNNSFLKHYLLCILMVSSFSKWDLFSIGRTLQIYFRFNKESFPNRKKKKKRQNTTNRILISC